ncbi:MAG: S8 family serine peptidase [Crocinitomicaceae bacterium]|nr:S8 family serine peptidase [Crocinitomicaceae bacterium]
MKRFLPKVIVSSILALLLSISHSFAQLVEPNFLDGVIYMKVEDTSAVDLSNYAGGIPDLDQIVANYSVYEIKKPFKTPNASLQKVYRFAFDDIISANSIISDLEALPFVEYAEKAPIYNLDLVPNDYNSSSQWYLDKIQAPDAWNLTTGSSSVKVAVVDNAVAIDHEDLQANIYNNPNENPGNTLDDDLNGYADDINGYDVADDDNDPRPPVGTVNTSQFIHGTHVAGIVSATTDNGMGVSSLGYSISIIPVKCSEDAGDGTYLTHAYEGVDYAISAGADIINMSFGSSDSFLTWDLLVSQAQAQGILMVAAAGNSDTSAMHYPAGYSYVFSVGATDQNDMRAGFSNYGSWVDVMAPGLGIESTLVEGQNSYGYLSGTSMASPVVAALAGLVMSLEPGASAQDVKTFIENGCDPIDQLNSGYEGQLGAGRINAYKTLLVAIGQLSTYAVEPAPEEMFIYPNPSNGEFNVVFDKTLNGGDISIYDFIGREVYTTEHYPAVDENTLTLDLKLFEKGKYYIIYNTGDRLIKRRLFIE